MPYWSPDMNGKSLGEVNPPLPFSRLLEYSSVLHKPLRPLPRSPPRPCASPFAPTHHDSSFMSLSALFHVRNRE